MRIGLAAACTLTASLLHPRCPPCRCIETPPRDLDSVVAQARVGVREALLVGKRGLVVETSMASLDVTSRAFDPPVLARFALEISKALTVVEGDVLVLLPGMSTAMEARQLLEKEQVAWPEADRERLSVSSLGMQGAPPLDRAADAPPAPAAVVLVGLTPAASSDDPTLRNARAWMREAKVALVINPRLPEPRPIEFSDCETAYCLMTYTVARTDTWKGEDANKYTEDAGSAVLWRTYPQDWLVMIDHGNADDWALVEELRRRPTEEALSSMLLPGVQARQAAVDSARAALGQQDELDRRGEDSRRRQSGGDDRTAASSGATGGESTLDARGVVAITWEQIQAAGSFGPMRVDSGSNSPSVGFVKRG